MAGTPVRARGLALLLATLSPIFFLFLSLCAVTVNAQITCYGIGGQSYTDNTLCPGSNACCGRRATCLSNRLCHNPNDPVGLWVRGPCAIKGWDDSCGQICLYNETETGGGVLPRVVECADGSLCCNNNPQCCQDRKGVFLDESGNVARGRALEATTSYPPFQGTGTVRTTMPVSTSSSTSTSSTSSSSSASLGSSISATGAAASISPPGSSSTTLVAGEPSPSGDSSVGLKVGLGLGIPLAVLITAVLAWLFLRKRKENAGTKAVAEVHGDSSYASEMANTHRGAATGYQAQGNYYNDIAKPPPYQYQQHSPIEMGGEMPTELDSRTLGTPMGTQDRHELL